MGCIEEEFRVRYLKMEDVDQVMIIAKNFFVPGEPICSGIHSDGESISDLLTEWIRDWISSGVSICAIHEESGQMASIALGKILTTKDREAFTMGDYKNKKGIQLSKIMDKVQNAYDIFKDQKMQKVYEFAMMATVSEFKGKGLATRLLQKTFDIAREAGCQASISQATGLISQRINKKCGYETMLKIPYDSLEIDGEKVFDLAAMHKATYLAIDLKTFIIPKENQSNNKEQIMN